MGQEILPLFIEGNNNVNAKVSYEYHEDDDAVYYSLYCMPIYSHKKTDKRGFQLIIAQLIINGHCRNCDIIRTFCVTSISVKRAVKKYRDEGVSSFFKPKATRKKAVLTKDVLLKAQKLLDEGESRSDVANELSIKVNTLSKAIQCGKLNEPLKKTLNPQAKVIETVKTVSKQ